MCGINGFLGEDHKTIERMNIATRHRGPDDTGTMCTGGFSIGNNRLAIIDVSPRAHQPMVSPDGNLTLVYNGELYNYKELRAILGAQGRVFRSDSDTEVVLAAYEAWGPACLARFNGIFAFAVVHTREERLFLARDHAGVNPLHYFWDGKTFVFSSEIKAILEHPAVHREIDPTAFNLYARLLYIPAPHTIWKNIYTLLPGHTATYAAGELTVAPWWRLTDTQDMTDRVACRARIKETVESAVTMQLVADRPVGVFLSGGIDSTVVCGVAARRGAGGGSGPASRLKTFSVGFHTPEESGKYNADFYLARATARHFNTDHHEFMLSGRDVCDRFERAIYHMDQPTSNPIQMVNLFLAEQTVQHVTVALGGDGGDEVWGGYERYWRDYQIERVRRMPPRARRALMGALAVAGHVSPAATAVAQKCATQPGADRYMTFWGIKEHALAAYINPAIHQPHAAHDFFAARYFTPERMERAGMDATKLMMETDLLTWLPDESLARSNKMGMAVGLETRVPLLDPRLITLGFQTPTAWKLHGARAGKYIFREALKEYLPPHVLHQKKRGWFSPASKWLRTDLKDFAYDTLATATATGAGDYFDLVATRVMLDKHIKNRITNTNALWSVLSFCVWYKQCNRGIL